MSRAIIYLVGGALLFVAAAAAYPFFISQGFKGFEKNPPTVVVMVDGSLGKVSSVGISAPRDGSSAVLTVSQSDLTQPTSPEATVYLAVERWVEGATFDYMPLKCSINTGDPTLTTVDANGPIAQAGAQGLMTSGLTANGSFTAVTFGSPVEGPTISCPLESFGFSQESIAVSSIYIPGMEVYSLDGQVKITRSYTIERGPSDYVERASQQPSEVLATALE